MYSIVLLIVASFGFGLTTCSDTSIREYHYVNQSLTWSEAQNYCREKYTDLATIESVEDLSRLKRPSGDNSLSWIGLSDDPKSWKGVMGNDSNSWRWSATGKTSETGYKNWGPGEANNKGGRETCVLVNKEGRWRDTGCSAKLPFVCYNDTNPLGQRSYTAINNPVTWRDGQTYCRRYHTDLAIIENARENVEIVSGMGSTMLSSHLWIGLYRVSWRWSDKSSSSFRSWRSGQPNNYGSQYCAAENSRHDWHDIGCNQKIAFWCYKDLRVKMTLVRMNIQTVSDILEPATNSQILQQLSERFKTLRSDVKLRWVTQPTKQEEDADEDSG